MLMGSRTIAMALSSALLIAAGIVGAAGAADVRDAFNSARQVADFADHVEDGIEVAEAVNRTKNVARLATGGAGSAVVEKTIGEVADNKVQDVVQDEFRNAIEDEIGDEIADSVTDRTRRAVRKQVIR